MHVHRRLAVALAGVPLAFTFALAGAAPAFADTENPSSFPAGGAAQNTVNDPPGSLGPDEALPLPAQPTTRGAGGPAANTTGDPPGSLGPDEALPLPPPGQDPNRPAPPPPTMPLSPDEVDVPGLQQMSGDQERDVEEDDDGGLLGGVL